MLTAPLQPDQQVHDLPREVIEALDAIRNGTAATPTPDGKRGPLSESELTTLTALGLTVGAKRDEAVKDRKSSGIEEVWANAEEAYLGIDDANRGQFAAAKWTKPTTMEGPLTTNWAPATDEYASTAYVRLTSRYVDAGAAKMGEILLPADDKAFSFEPTPVPFLVKHKDSPAVMQNHDGSPMLRDARPDETAAPMGAVPSTLGPSSLPASSPAGTSPAAAAVGTAPPTVPITVRDVVREALDKARDAAKKAETRIYDWMVEASYTREMRKVIFDAARLGVGILKGPYPKKVRAQELSKSSDESGAESNAMQLQIVDRIVPWVSWVDVWNIFPDASCGENIHDGDYILERAHLSRRQVTKLKGTPGYLDEQIDKVLAEGPQKVVKDQTNPTNSDQHLEKRFEVWFFYGMISKEELAAANPKHAATVKEGQNEVYAIVTLVNDTAIRATLNPLDSGEFPYHGVPWQRRPDHWAGVGIAEQVMMPQRMVTAATRAMLDNAGKSSGFQLIVDRGCVVPADGSYTNLGRTKVWYKKGDSAIDDVRKAFMAVQFPNTTDHLMTIIEYAFRLAEESTSIPLITQGQSGKTTPETLGATQLQNNNANQLLRSIGYSFDDHITEPLVKQFYEWLLLDPEIPDDEKGDFTINAHGSVAMVERAIQEQFLFQIGPMVTNPAFGMSPKKFATEILKARHLDPRTIQYSEEEQKKIDSSPPPVAPQVQAAQIRAATDEKLAQADQALEKYIAELDAQTTMERSRVDTDRDRVYVEAETNRTRVESEVRLLELEAKKQLAIVQYANQRQISLEQVKADLASVAMKLKVQKELAGADAALDMHKHRNPPPVMKPPTEPPGRAKPGRAFQS